MTDEQKAMLELVQAYGDGMSLSGPRVSRKSREVARTLLNRGLLAGRMGSLSLTDAGRARLQEK